MPTIKRALLSCSDKTGLQAFAKTLASLGVELVASGGTAEFLAGEGLTVRTVEEFAGIREQLDGRVKTLHPKIHAGILARRDDPAHVKAVGAQGLIDLVVVNVYPFEAVVREPSHSMADALEQIDIGGVALLRAAAKNHGGVAVVCRPDQYAAVGEALRQGRGSLPDTLTRELAAAAFALTSAYDTAIAGYLAGSDGAAGAAEPPERVHLSLRRQQVLRYGENPHQPGAWYVPDTRSVWGLGTLTQLQGKELSYNNLLDGDAALRCLLDLTDPACAIVKHASLCGLAAAADLGAAYSQAYACDPESAFGGIVGVNRPVDRALAEQLAETFLEVILAPAVEPAAQARLGKKPNLRVLTVDWPARHPGGWELRQVLGGWLGQGPDTATVLPADARVATKRAPSAAERTELGFAWLAAKHARSNAVVITRGRATVGIGQGQPSRVGAVRAAVTLAGDRARGAVAASDGFFPFPDGLDALAKAGVTAVAQPGGSRRDAEVIAAADAAGMAMLLTEQRHFRH